MSRPHADQTVVCFITGSAGDWGGASRVLYTNLRLLDRTTFQQAGWFADYSHSINAWL